MRRSADVKLKKSCEVSSDCQECRCKPMWCLQCKFISVLSGLCRSQVVIVEYFLGLGKWFAYRQDQSQPGTWLSSKATCATCRAKFCLLDVALIDLV